MPKRALVLLILLSIIATLLIGINIGKRLGVSQYLTQKQPLEIASSPSPFNIPTLIPTQTVVISESIQLFRDTECGYEFQYTGIAKKTQNEKYASLMITNPENPDNPALVATCQEEIPKPPLPAEKIEAIILDGVKTNLYHDASQKDGSPRDEIIVRHPLNNLEIIIAGFGPAFQEATSSFKFLGTVL